MKGAAVRLGLALALCGLTGTRAFASSCSQSDRQKAIAEITAIEHEMAAAQGVAGVTRTWSNDMVWYEIGPVEIHGGGSARALTAEQFKALGQVRTRIVRLTVKADCEIGYAYSAQNFVSDLAGNKGTLNFMFRETDIFEKRGGKWMLVHQHISVPGDLSTGKVIMTDHDLLDFPLSVAPKP